MNPTIKALGIRFLINVFDGVGVAVGVFTTMWLISQII